jgi:hypothetical protein
MEINKSEIVSLVHSLWCWITQDTSLLQSTLSMLCTLTANNKEGSNLLMQTSFTYPLIMSSANTGSASILQLVIKVLSKSINKYPVQKYGFCVLTNCASLNECRTILWKVILTYIYSKKKLFESKLNVYFCVYAKEQSLTRFHERYAIENQQQGKL